MRTQFDGAGQEQKYAALLEFIQREKALGRDVVLVGGRQISLRMHQTEKRWKGISTTSEVPIYRQNGQLHLSNWDYEQYQSVKALSAALGEPYKALVLRLQPFDPKKKAADLEAYARAYRERCHGDEPPDGPSTKGRQKSSDGSSPNPPRP